LEQGRFSRCLEASDWRTRIHGGADRGVSERDRPKEEQECIRPRGANIGLGNKIEETLENRLSECEGGGLLYTRESGARRDARSGGVG
jgi:hypothetical protein